MLRPWKEVPLIYPTKPPSNSYASSSSVLQSFPLSISVYTNFGSGNQMATFDSDKRSGVDYAGQNWLEGE
jgi:hypothetical protein